MAEPTWAERYWSMPCFFVWPHPQERFGDYVRAETAGKAKAQRWRETLDTWPDFPFTGMRARKVSDGHPLGRPEREASDG